MENVLLENKHDMRGRHPSSGPHKYQFVLVAESVKKLWLYIVWNRTMCPLGVACVIIMGT